jgi:uncharacterized protein (TIGR03086 family)
MGDVVALADLARAIAGTETIVAGITAGQWSWPTPCTGLDVSNLVNHLVTGNLLFGALVTGAPPPDRDADHLGGDPLGAFRRAGAALRDAFAQPGVLEKTYTAPFGTGPGIELVRTRIIEQLGHGWDLARATGQPATFPDDVAERALAAARVLLATRPSGGGWVPFAPEVPVPEGAPTIDRLAGFLGRSVLVLAALAPTPDARPRASASRQGPSAGLGVMPMTSPRPAPRREPGRRGRARATG